MQQLVVITGASRGIGVAIAQDFAKDGSTLILTARSRAGLEKTAQLVRAAGGRPLVLPLDMAKPDDRETLVATAEAQGAIDVFINNAAVEYPFPVMDQSCEEIERQLQLNLHAPIFLARRLLPAMTRNKRGTIVMMSSMGGKWPEPFNTIYSATKYGLTGFVSSLQFELEGTGVHVGAVCPGYVGESGMWVDGGIKAPALVGAVPHKKVVAAVRKVVAGQCEVLVNPTPVRPVLALVQILPSLVLPITQALGGVEASKKRVLQGRVNHE